MATETTVQAERIESLESEAFSLLFTTFAHTAYRLETLQEYGVAYEDEPFRRFLAGESPLADPAKSEWVSVIRKAVVAGKQMQRVHVVAEPPTDYIRYELALSYEPNVAAGEDIRVIPVRPGQWPSGLPRHDYWLFDSRKLWTMSYDDEGRFRYAEHVRDPEEIVRHAFWRDAALHQATRYADYMRGRPSLR